jgi:hypothetical protein
VDRKKSSNTLFCSVIISNGKKIKSRIQKQISNIYFYHTINGIVGLNIQWSPHSGIAEIRQIT